MRKQRSLLDLATKYHEGLPRRIREYLNARGIPDFSIDYHLIGWNGGRITIPIFNREGELAFFKLARDPKDESLTSPKMMTWPNGYVELYGWGQVLGKPHQIIICEGEFDRLVLEANGFRTVTSTGGAGTFRPEWAREFLEIPEVYICFDRDEAGRDGALRVGRMIPHSRIVELPEEVAEGGDVTDFFAHLGHTREDFLKLLEQAKPAPPAPPESIAPDTPRPSSDSPERQRIEEIKRKCPIADVVRQYVQLQSSGDYLFGLCPFHKDHRPSLVVYPATGSFYCFGCRMRGDVITFIREVEHLSFNQALDALDQFKNQEHESERSGAFNVRGQTVMQQSEVPLSITECGDSCFKLAPSIPLKEGEYGFSPTDSNDTFSFSLVASTSTSSLPQAITSRNAGQPEILTNEDIIALNKAGLSDELIITKIKTSRGIYKLETEDIIVLKNQGLSEAIILAMIEAVKNH